MFCRLRSSSVLARRNKATQVTAVHDQLMAKPATPHCHSHGLASGEPDGPEPPWMIPKTDWIIHTEIKAAPMTAAINWQTPVTLRPARMEPVPGVATLIMMHDQARSRLNGRWGERAIGNQ